MIIERRHEGATYIINMDDKGNIIDLLLIEDVDEECPATEDEPSAPSHGALVLPRREVCWVIDTTPAPLALRSVA